MAGRFDESKQILHDFEKVVPGLVVVALRRCGIERRQAQVPTSSPPSPSRAHSCRPRSRRRSGDPAPRTTRLSTRTGPWRRSRPTTPSSPPGPPPAPPCPLGLSPVPALSRYEKLLRDPKLPTRVHTYYAVKFARFNALVRKDRRLAEKILLDAMQRDKVGLRRSFGLDEGGIKDGRSKTPCSTRKWWT